MNIKILEQHSTEFSRRFSLSLNNIAFFIESQMDIWIEEKTKSNFIITEKIKSQRN